MYECRIALVTGADRGLGFEISRQLGDQGMTVLMGARDIPKGKEAVQRLRDEGIDAWFVYIDLSDSSSLRTTTIFIVDNFGKLDVLVNNEDVLLDRRIAPSEITEITLRRTFETNFFGPYLLTRHLVPLLAKSDRARVVNLAPQAASLYQIADPDSPLMYDICPAYQTSKVALNVMTVLLAKELRSLGIKVNSACPGWLLTDIYYDDLPDYGYTVRPLSTHEAVENLLWLTTLPDDGPTGHFFSHHQPVPW